MPQPPTWHDDAPPLKIEVRQTPEPQTGLTTTIALEDWANQTLDDDLHTGQLGDNNLVSLPRGSLTLAGVHFQVDDKLIQLGSSQVPHHPPLVEGIDVGQPFRRLHIIHAAVQPVAVPLRTVLAHYRVHYEDGPTEMLPVRYGLDVWNFWASESQLTHLHLETRPSPSLRTAWVGKNPPAAANSKQVRLYVMSWTNPRPDRPVTQIDLVAAEPTSASLICVALTSER
jgi:hypothetical protein